MKPDRVFRELHAPGRLLRLPNAWDAGSARLIEAGGAAAIATIHVLLEEGLLDQATEKGEYLLGRMNELAGEHPKVMLCGRGRGLMLGMEFMSDEIGYAVSKNLFARQILISGTYINSRVLRVEPALNIAYPQLDTFLNALEDSLGQVERDRRLA